MFKGRPVLGTITGFLFGLFLGPTLWLWGVIPFHSPLMWILPLVGIVLGLLMAAWAPFGTAKAAAAGPSEEAATTMPPMDASGSDASVGDDSGDGE